MRKNYKGFTLIEVMIVVAIIGILATIAYPSYIDSVRKSKRSDAKTALIDLRIAQEKLRANCPFYAQVLLNAGAAGATCGANSGATDLGYSSTSSPQGYYTIAISAGTASGVAYTATATGLGDLANDTGCNVITLAVSAGGDTLTPQNCL